MTNKENVEKNTLNDRVQLMHTAIREQLDDTYYYKDSTEEFIYVSDWQDSCHYQFSYSMDGDTLVVDKDSMQKVTPVQDTTYVTVERSVNKSGEDTSWLKKLKKLIDESTGGTQQPSPVPMIQKFSGQDVDKLWAVEPLYIAPGEVDAHGETVTLETTEYMVESLNKANKEGRLQSGLFHKHKTQTWSLDKAWVNPHDCMIGDEFIPEGQPIAKTVFHSSKLHDMRMKGEITGLSIGAKGFRDTDKQSVSEVNPEADAVLKGINFDWEHPELTYTSPSQGGAASMKNQVYDVSKAKKATIEDLDKEQLGILDTLGEEFISLEKHLGEDKKQTPSSSEQEVNSGEELETEKGKGEMSQTDLEKQLADQQTLIKSLMLEKKFSKFELTEDTVEAISKSLAPLENEAVDAVVKALTELKEKADVDKADAVDKAKNDVTDNSLGQILDKEAGEGGEPEEKEEEKPLSIIERALQYKKGA